MYALQGPLQSTCAHCPGTCIALHVVRRALSVLEACTRQTWSFKYRVHCRLCQITAGSCQPQALSCQRLTWWLCVVCSLMAEFAEAYEEFQQTAEQQKHEALAELRQDLETTHARALAEKESEHRSALSTLQLERLQHETEVLRNHSAAMATKDATLQQMWDQAQSTSRSHRCCQPHIFTPVRHASMAPCLKYVCVIGNQCALPSKCVSHYSACTATLAGPRLTLQQGNTTIKPALQTWRDSNPCRKQKKLDLLMVL